MFIILKSFREVWHKENRNHGIWQMPHCKDIFINYKRLLLTMDKKIKPITLKIDLELWNSFKDKVPRTITLNDKIVALIKKEVNHHI